MTVAVQTNSNTYTGDGVTTAFDFNFYAVDPSWIHVTVDDVPVTPASIILDINQSTNPGGTVHFTTAPLAATRVLLQRVTPLTQLTLYQAQDPFPAIAHMNALDKLTAETQDLSIRLDAIDIPVVAPGDALKFLQVNETADGLRWNDVLPKPYVPGLVLGATTPTDLAWVPGGGGGGGIILGPFSNTPTAEGLLLDGVLFNVLHSTAADDTHAGAISLAPQYMGRGTKLFKDGAAWNVHDLRSFGALPVSSAIPNNATADVYPQVQAAIAAWTQQGSFPFTPNGNLQGGIYFSEGIFFTSRPLIMPQGCTFYGDSKYLSVIAPGMWPTGTVGKCEGFAGPLIYPGGAVVPGQVGLPTFAASLLTGPGQSLQLVRDLAPIGVSGATCIVLSDSAAFAELGSVRIADWSLQFQFAPDETVGPGPNEYSIITSCGPNVWTLLSDHNDMAFGVWLANDGANMVFKARLSTENIAFLNVESPTANLYTITGTTPLTQGVAYNVEIDFDGFFFDFYVNGVSQGHVAVSGNSIARAPWEGVMIGCAGPEFSNQPNTYFSAHGRLDSVRVSNIHRHSGTGSFTPPTSKYAWDANTLWLFNPLDPAYGTDPLTLGEPFVIAQSIGCSDQNFPSTHFGPVKHWMRLMSNVLGPSMNCTIRDLQLLCNHSVSGVCTWGASRFQVENLLVLSPTHVGLKNTDGVSFFFKGKEIDVFWSYDYGLLYFGDVEGADTSGCGIGAHVVAGALSDHKDQCAWNAYASLMVGGNPTAFSTITLKNCVNDAEGWPFHRVKSFFMHLSSGGLTSEGSIYDASGSTKPPWMFVGGAESELIQFKGDLFKPDSSLGPCAIFKYGTFSTGRNTKVKVTGCNKADFDLKPWCNIPGFVIQDDGQRQTLQTGISQGDIFANNLSGTVDIIHGQTIGSVKFLTAEPDSDYTLYITPKSHTGSAPAAGSTRVKSYTCREKGFDVEVEADPAGTCILTLSWLLIRSVRSPLLNVFGPATPGTHSNPFAGTPAPWALGVTVVPTNAAFRYDANAATEYMMMMGVATPAAVNNWSLSILAGRGQGSVGTAGFTLYNAFVGSDGELHSWFSPGPHNILVGDNASNGYFIGMDGGLAGFNPYLSAGDAGNQTTPFYVGQLFDTTHQLTLGTIRRYKMDPDLSTVITIEADSGPLPGQAEYMFIGDDWLMGLLDRSGNGGWATQIAEARYGTGKYCHMACHEIGAILNDTILGQGLVDMYWNAWGGFQDLDCVVIAMPFWDLLLHGSLATDIFTKVKEVIEGAKAHATFSPQTATVAAPIDWSGGILNYNNGAWALFVNPTANGSVIINGVTIPFTFNTDAHQTCIDIANAINANGTLGPIITALAYNTPATGGQWCVLCQAGAGAVGNLYSMAISGGGPTFGMYPGGTFSPGVDNVVIIGGVHIVNNWLGSAAATLTDIVNKVTANPTLSGLVAASSVAGQMYCEALVTGDSGNSIGVSTNGVLIGVLWDVNVIGINHMTGGVNGAGPLGVGTIILSTVPPIADDFRYSAAKETQRQALNTSIRGYAAFGTIIADVDALVTDGASPPHIQAIYLDSPGLPYLNSAGHTAMFGLFDPLIP